MEKSPAERYADAGQLAEDLRCYLRVLPVQARSLGVVERARRWARCNPVVAGLTTTVTLLLLVITLGAVGVASHLARSRVELARALEDAEAARLEADASAREAEQQAATASENARQALEAKQQAEDALRRAQQQDELREKAEKEAEDISDKLAKARVELEAATRELTTAEQETAKAREELKTIEQENASTAYLIQINRAYQEWRKGNLKSAEEALTACPEAQRSWEWHYLNAPELHRPPIYVPAARNDLFTKLFTPTTYLSPDELRNHRLFMQRMGPSVVSESRDGHRVVTRTPRIRPGDAAICVRSANKNDMSTWRCPLSILKWIVGTY